MNGPKAAEFNLVFSGDHLKPALLISLLSVWVLVGVFYFLNTYTRRRYFTIWTTAWLFYALWLTLFFLGAIRPGGNAFVGVVAHGVVPVCFGGFLALGQPSLPGAARQPTAHRFEPGHSCWCGVLRIAIFLTDTTGVRAIRMHWSVFGFIGFASLITAAAFFRYRRLRPFLGAALLSVGFFLWGAYLGTYPLYESEALAATGFLISAVLQLLIAVSMIILVLEQVRFNLQRRDLFEKVRLQNKVWFTEERYQRLFQQAHEAIVIVARTDLRILELNRAAESLLGVKLSQAISKSLTSFCQIKHARSTRLRRAMNGSS
jgi:PAS domain-containing protein